MDPSNRRVVVEPSGTSRIEQLGGSLLGAITDHATTNLSGEPRAQGFGGHTFIVARLVGTLRSVPEDSAPPVPDPTGPAGVAPAGSEVPSQTYRLPGWVVPSIALFWIGFLLSGVVEALWLRLSGLLLLLVISLFLALAVEPGVNRMARRGWRRGRATAAILIGVLLAAGGFVGAIGTLVGTQIADLLQNSETYIVDTVDSVNDLFNTEIDPQRVVDRFNDPDGPIQRYIDSQQDEVIQLSVQALGGLVAAFSTLLFTYYLVADGPRLRRAICRRLPPERQRQVLAAWELAINKTGGYLYSRALLALLSALFHWVVFQAAGIQAPIPMAIWVGLVSQFLPVVGTYIAGLLPVLITFLDSPVKAAVVLAFIIVYQQIENYFFAPRITARTMELHPAVAFGSALAGFSLLGAAGAILALPAAAMVQALLSEWGAHHDVVESSLTELEPQIIRRRRRTSDP